MSHPISLSARIARVTAKYAYLAGVYAWLGYRHTSNGIARLTGGTPLPLVRSLLPNISPPIPELAMLTCSFL